MKNGFGLDLNKHERKRSKIINKYLDLCLLMLFRQWTVILCNIFRFLYSAIQRILCVFSFESFSVQDVKCWMEKRC